MSLAIIITIAFSIGFFVESIIGLGGGIIAYVILGFFMDVKQMVIVALYIGTCSSAYIAFSDFKNFDKRNFFPKLPICLVGTVIGVLIFSKINSSMMAIFLGCLLIFLSAKMAFLDKIKLPKLFQNKLLLIGGISHGMFGIGGPFIANALKDNFKNKSTMRATMAVFFVAFNIVRFIQLSWQNQIDWSLILNIWWVIIPVFIAIKLGHLFHLKISEEFFKKMIALVTVCAGIKFLLY